MDEGYRCAVDIDLEKYFETVNHDKLIGLIRKYLNAGVMEKGLTSPTIEGVPLISIIKQYLLNELDMELEQRGLRFCRYADDCNVYVKSKKSA